MGPEAGSTNNPLPAPPVAAIRQPARWLNVVLLFVALVGWITFVVACVSGPAWSPDGSKVLFGYYDEDNSRVSIALYDRSTHKTRDLFTALGGTKDDKAGTIGLAPVWQTDGSRAIIGVASEVPGGDDLHCSLVSIPIKSDAPLQMYNLGRKVACWSAAFLPQIADTVYLTGDDGLTTLNLRTGEINYKEVSGGGLILAEHNGRLVYVRDVSRPAPTPENKDATENGLEVGEVDLKDVTPKPFYSLWKNDADIEKLKEDLGGAWEPGGTRIAMILRGSDTDEISLLDEKKKVVGRLTPNLRIASFHLGMPVWSSSRNLLYVPAWTPREKEKQFTFSLAEIPLNGGPGKLTRIADFEWKSSDELKDYFYLGMQFSLSPDGKTLAASTATMGDGVAKADRALFLIDVAHPEHKIARIPPPKHAKSR